MVLVPEVSRPWDRWHRTGALSAGMLDGKGGPGARRNGLLKKMLPEGGSGHVSASLRRKKAQEREIIPCVSSVCELISQSPFVGSLQTVRDKQGCVGTAVEELRGDEDANASLICCAESRRKHRACRGFCYLRPQPPPKDG